MAATGSTPPDSNDRKTIIAFDKYRGTSASTFTASSSTVPVNCAFNGIFSVSFNLPFMVRTAMKVNISQDIQNDAEPAIQAGRLFTIFPVKVSERGLLETKGSHGRTVSEISGVLLKEFFEDRASVLYELITCAFVTIGAGIGPASEQSRPDLCVHSAPEQTVQAGLLVGEFKDTAYCPLEMLGQAFASAAISMMRQKKLGLGSTEAAVPIILSTGNLMQFASATTPDPFFPVLSVTSRVLDVSDYSNMREASEALARTKLFC